MREAKIRGLIRWSVLLSYSALLGACGQGSEQSPRSREVILEGLVHSYLAAANAHDLDAVRRMFGEQAEWLLMGTVLRGRTEILGPHEQDISLHTRLRVEVDSARTDTVWARVTEWNDFIAVFGLESVRHRIQIVFQDSLIAWMGPVEDGAQDPFDGALGPFFGWVRGVKPEAWKALVDESGKPVYGLDSGVLLVRLAKEWKAKPH